MGWKLIMGGGGKARKFVRKEMTEIAKGGRNSFEVAKISSW